MKVWNNGNDNNSVDINVVRNVRDKIINELTKIDDSVILKDNRINRK